MKIVFMGTSEFAVPSLKELNQNYDIKAVYTKKDKKSGRGMKLKEGKVKKAAKSLSIPVRTPTKLDKEEIEYINNLNVDLIAVICYGLKIPETILNLPKKFVINAHASLLPKYRGASPINKAVIEGDKKTGVTVFKLNRDWDAGDILFKYSLDITKKETASSLWERLRHLSAYALSDSIEKIKQNDYSLTPQDHEKATFAYKIDKDDVEIDWSKTVDKIEREIRGYFAWPIAFSFLEGKRLKIYSVKKEKKNMNKKPGEIVDINKNKGIGVAAGDGLIYLKEIKLAGKRKMNYKDFLNGYDLKEGVKLG